MYYFYKKSLDNEGVTLTEILVTLSILSILTALAALGHEFVSSDRIWASSRQLVGDILWLRHSSITHGTDANVPGYRGFGIRVESAHLYHLFRFNDINANFKYDGTNEEFPLSSRENSPGRRDVPAPLALKIKKSNGTLEEPKDNVLFFDQAGIPRQSNFGIQKLGLVIENSDINEVRKKCISVSLNRVREGQWIGEDCEEQ